MKHPLILIVDPDADARLILSLFLRHHGHGTEEADSAEAGLALARRLRPDLIVGEHPLALPDGRILCQVLADDPETRGIPFVAVTAGALPGELADAHRGHWAGVLTKPTTPAEILACVREVLGQPA